MNHKTKLPDASVIVYSPDHSNRLVYVIRFLEYYFHTGFALTHNSDEYLSAQCKKINYSAQPLSAEEIWIEPAGLLSQTGISQQAIDIFNHANGFPAFFRKAQGPGFDLFSSLFYLVSRYEEYLPHEKDAYGRYAHHNSIAYQNGFLDQPVVDVWLRDLGKILGLPQTSPPSDGFRFQPTYDIDIAWSYRHKGHLRSTGGLVRHLMAGELFRALTRMRVLMGFEPDPYDSYAWMNALHDQFELDPVYFFHVGSTQNRYDKNIPREHPEMQKLIRETAGRYRVGLHPSWSSGDQAGILPEEKKWLEQCTGSEITVSRQHYIRFTLPHTYRSLLDAGIREDYSMGYGSINGFRASFSCPFYWYDLEKEKETALLLHPFCFMEANAFFEQRQTAQEAGEELKKFSSKLSEVNGEMVTIFHNTFLGTDPLYKGWRDMYKNFIEFLSVEQHSGLQDIRRTV